MGFHYEEPRGDGEDILDEDEGYEGSVRDGDQTDLEEEFKAGEDYPVDGEQELEVGEEDPLGNDEEFEAQFEDEEFEAQFEDEMRGGVGSSRGPTLLRQPTFTASQVPQVSEGPYLSQGRPLSQASSSSYHYGTWYLILSVHKEEAVLFLSTL
ncbi:hypothetical protein BVRB_4g086020 [Beta vulgaris subsp. vulgaris]|nr:hypothetical protein BVRB_4g086020 [Beta vulgaris subsp. vulgaris]